MIRSSRWRDSTRTIDGCHVADDELVLAYLQESLEPRARWNGDSDPITPTERIELAVEWLLRNEIPVGVATLRATKTEQTIRRILLQRGPNEPPTESYAETRFVQQMRKFGITKVFRQVRLYRGDEIVNRIDIVIPFLGRARPKRFGNHIGIPVEIDGKAFHIDTFAGNGSLPASCFRCYELNWQVRSRWCGFRTRLCVGRFRDGRIILADFFDG